MNKIFTLLAAVICLTAPVKAQVVLNELYVQPGSGNHEFFELYNTSTNASTMSLDGYTLISYFEEGTKRGFYVFDFPNVSVASKHFFVAASAKPFNFQGTTGSMKADISWNDPALDLNSGYLKKWVDNGLNLADGNKNYDLEPVIPGLNDFFTKRSGTGSSYNAFVYKNGVLINTFFGGTGGSGTMPTFITSMPVFKVTSVTAAVTSTFTINYNAYRNKPIESVQQDPGTDNGYTRQKNGACGTWIKSTASVNHTPGVSNGSFVATGSLTIDTHIARGATPADSSVIRYNITGGPADAFPVDVQLYLDNGSIPGEIDGNDQFLQSKTENNVAEGSTTIAFRPRDANIMLIAKSVAGCIAQTVYVSIPPAAAGIALPITITHLDAFATGNNAIINWSVAENELTQLYVIEKSSNGKQFTTAGSVKASSKWGAAHYVYTDSMTGTTFYRILFVPPSEGKPEYSKTLLVEAKAAHAPAVVLLENPVKGRLSFQYKADTAGTMIVSVYGMTGSKVWAGKINVSKNYNQVSIDAVQNLKPAIYVLEISNGIKRETIRFVKG